MTNTNTDMHIDNDEQVHISVDDTGRCTCPEPAETDKQGHCLTCRMKANTA